MLQPIPSLLLLFLLLPCAFPFPGLSGLGCPHTKDTEGSIVRALHKRAAAPFNPEFPYTNARYDGLPGNGTGDILVPSRGDTGKSLPAYQKYEPTTVVQPTYSLPLDPMIFAALAQFISHDGITTFTEMVAASQNIYNMGWDLAVVLAALAIIEDGDIITEKCSIGHAATSQTGFLGGILSGTEGGYNDHNKFEGDTSLTRNDFFLDPARDNFGLNGTLFSYMTQTANQISGGLFNRDTLVAYQAQRYRQSLADNGQFFYGPKAIILLGAATFVFHLFPNGGIEGTPDLPVTASFFGAIQDASASGGFRYTPEKIPPFWHNTPKPYGLLELVSEVAVFLERNPEENVFGGNVGRGNFVPINFGAIKNGKLGGDNPPKLNDVACLIYQILTDNTPSGLDSIITKPFEVVQWVLGRVNQTFGQYGCALLPVM